MKRAYYNELDPYAAQWLRNLIDADLIPRGDVDERSIVDVAPSDLAGYTQCHFFAGIGGWAYAARLAGWPDDRELWTGSPPCQPFSVAGAQRGTADDRHLWPHLFRLIRARRPAVVMGEQVAAAVGKNWLDGVFADLESVGYSSGAAVVPACAVNAPHRRDRLWFVADANRIDCGQGDTDAGRCADGSRSREVAGPQRAGHGAMADTCGERLAQRVGDTRVLRAMGGESERENAPDDARALGDSDIARASEGRQQRSGELGGVGFDTSSRSAWNGASWIIGHDGKARRIEPSIRLLAHGLRNRVGQLRAYGNAIVPQVAAEVIGAYLDAELERAA